MSIRFPKMHVAKSTVNRILNVSDEIDRQIMPKLDIDTPSLPAADPSGKSIEVAVNTPSEPVAAPPGIGPEILGQEPIV